MDRARVVLAAVVVSAFCGATGLIAQTATSAEGWVVLPVEEYRALRERAIPPAPPPPAPPVDATLTRVDYDLRVDSDSVSGRALLTIDVLRDRLDPRPDSRRPDGARCAGSTASRSRSSKARRRTCCWRAPAAPCSRSTSSSRSRRRRARNRSRFRRRRRRSRASRSCCRRAASISRSTGGFIAERAETAGESRWTAFGRPNQPLTLSWKRKVDDRRAELPLRVRARADERRRARRRRLPDRRGGARRSAAGARARGHAGAAGGARGQSGERRDGRRLGRSPAACCACGCSSRPPPRSRSSCRATCARRARARSPCRCVRMPSAERESGGVAVDVVGAGEIAGRQARGLEPADPSELGDVVAGRESPSMIAFRLKPLAGSEPRSLAVTVVRYTPQAVLVANIEEARYRALASEDGRLLVEARYAVRNNQRSFLKVTMPAGSTVWSAEVGGPSDPAGRWRRATRCCCRSKRDAPATRRRPSSSSSCTCSGSTRGSDKGRARIDLPALDLPVSRTGLELHYSPRFRVEPQPGAFRVEQRSRSVRRGAARAGAAGRRRRAVAARQASGPPADCRRSSIASETKPAGARSSARCRCT